MIRLENVCFAYEKEIALRYVNLHIKKEILWLSRDQTVVENQHLLNY